MNQIKLDLGSELVIDLFAGGGGASLGIEQGIGEDGKTVRLTKSDQVRMCGNSVCPPIARALVEANFRHEAAFMEVAA